MEDGAGIPSRGGQRAGCLTLGPRRNGSKTRTRRSAGPILETDVGERVAVGVADDEAVLAELHVGVIGVPPEWRCRKKEPQAVYARSGFFELRLNLDSSGWAAGVWGMGVPLQSGPIGRHLSCAASAVPELNCSLQSK
jgi:hypothetical protein